VVRSGGGDAKRLSAIPPSPLPPPPTQPPPRSSTPQTLPRFNEVAIGQIVGAVAPRIFGECTSVAAAKGGHAKGTEPAVLLRHTTSGSFLVASRSKTNLRGFVCQKGRPNGLNASSWEACRIDTKFAKTFETPAKGFVEGTTVKYDGQLYEVAGYTTNGWRTH
jgi:hypothetical protein